MQKKIKGIRALPACFLCLMLFSACGGAASSPANSTPTALKINTPSTQPASSPAESEPPLPSTSEQDTSEQNMSSNNTSDVLLIEFGSNTFTATLNDSPSTEVFKAMLPMTIEMADMNSNEKYHFMSDSLPTNSRNEDSIKNGDIMLYGSDCLVLFYEDFSTSYSYTKLGVLNDPTGLKEALGSGAVTVTWSLILLSV